MKNNWMQYLSIIFCAVIACFGSKVMKKIISIIAIVAGGMVLLSVAAPVLIGAILEFQMKAQVAGTVGIIGGADGPTSIMITGVTRIGSGVTEVVVGVLLIVTGIWGLRKNKK